MAANTESLYYSWEPREQQMTEKEMVKEWSSKGQGIIKVLFPETLKAFCC